MQWVRWYIVPLGGLWKVHMSGAALYCLQAMTSALLLQHRSVLHSVKSCSSKCILLTVGRLLTTAVKDQLSSSEGSDWFLLD